MKEANDCRTHIIQLTIIINTQTMIKQAFDNNFVNTVNIVGIGVQFTLDKKLILKYQPNSILAIMINPKRSLELLLTLRFPIFDVKLLLMID